MASRTQRFPLMDSLRAIAVLGVLVAHASFYISLHSTNKLNDWRVDSGVTLFFVISGFLIYRPWVRARLRGQPSPLVRVYAWRRLLRIVPGYWVALTAIAIALSFSAVFTWSGAPVYYGFAQTYFWEKTGGALVQAWSLCVEMAFYVFVPLYALGLARLRASDPARRLRHELIGVAALFAFSALYKVWAVQAGTLERPDLSAPLQLNLFAFLDQFAVGMGLAVASVWYEQRKELPAPLRLVDRAPWVPWLFAAVALYVVSFQIGLKGNVFTPFGHFQYFERHYLYLAIATGLVLPAMFGDYTRGWVRRLLANKVLLYIGVISYGIFLYHFFVLEALHRVEFGEVVPNEWGWLWLVAGVGGGVLLATLSWYLVERPFLRLKDRVGGPGLLPVDQGSGLASAAEPDLLPASDDKAMAASTTMTSSATWRKRGTP